MAKPWGGAGAWALDSELAESQDHDPLPPPSENPNFPSLKEAATTKQPKKKKPVTVPLAQFVSKGLTPEESLRLPSGPRPRSEDEPEFGRGGFRSGGFSIRRNDDGHGGFDGEGRRGMGSRGAEFDAPSRADGVDNWGAGKRSVSIGSSRGDRVSSFGSSSRADDVDNWANAKKPMQMPSRYSGSGYGGDSRGGEYRSESDRWTRGGGGGGFGSDNGERRRLVLDPPRKDVAAGSEIAKSRPSPFGAARPREEVLSEKGLDWKKIDSEMESKRSSRPTSSHSSRPSSAQSSRPGSPGLSAGLAALEVAPKSRPKVNPFGDAKPREYVLQEKGMDWRKIDLELEHRSVDRPETAEERQLKEEISQLKAYAKSAQISSEESRKLQEDIMIMENSLEILVHQLDDKVKFGQKATSNVRPGSGAGRSDTSSNRPPSQSGSQSGFPEDPRNIEFVDRPHSRGRPADIWSSTMDGRRGRQPSRERGFFESKNFERSGSKERW